LGFVKAGEEDFGVETLECEVFYESRGEREPVGGVEGIGESEVEGVAVGKVSVEDDVLATVIDGGLEVCDFGGELNVLKKVLRLEIERKGLVQADIDRAGRVGICCGID